MLALFYLGHVLGGGALRTLHDVELNPVALGKAAEALRLDGGVMDKAILVPILRGDETKTFCVVEPPCRWCEPLRLLHVYLPAPAPENPERRVFMSAGLSCVIKNERPEGDVPGLECHSKDSIGQTCNWVLIARTNLYNKAH
jgi:hypothetical protein